MKKLAIISIFLIAFVLPVCGDDQGDHSWIIISSVSGTFEIGCSANISVELMNNATRHHSPSIFGDNRTCLGIIAELHSRDEGIHVLSTPQIVGALAPGENRSVEFVASVDPGINVGTYPLDLILSYSRLYDVKATGNVSDIIFDYNNISDVLPLVVNVGLGPRLNLVADDVLAPGTESDLAIQFMNRGDEPISDLQVRLLAQDPFMPIGNEMHLSSIDPGSSISVKFGIFTANNTADGYYALPCSVSYKCSQFSRRDELAAIVEVKERSWSNIFVLPVIAMLIMIAIYLGIKARTGKRRLRKRL